LSQIYEDAIYECVREALTVPLGQEAADDVATNLTYVLDEGELETLADDEIQGYVVRAIETAAAECDVDLHGIDVETVAKAIVFDAVEAAGQLQGPDVEDDIAAGRSLADDDGSI
jgi:hypothetical protein